MVPTGKFVIKRTSQLQFDFLRESRIPKFCSRTLSAPCSRPVQCNPVRPEKPRSMGREIHPKPKDWPLGPVAACSRANLTEHHTTTVPNEIFAAHTIYKRPITIWRLSLRNDSPECLSETKGGFGRGNRFLISRFQRSCQCLALLLNPTPSKLLRLILNFFE